METKKDGVAEHHHYPNPRTTAHPKAGDGGMRGPAAKEAKRLHDDGAPNAPTAPSGDIYSTDDDK